MQQNVDYALSVSNILQKHSLVPVGYQPPRIGYHNPDIVLTYNNTSVGCDVKETLTSIEATLDYHTGNRAHPWQFSYISTNELDKTFLKQFVQSQGYLTKLKSEWHTAPFNLKNQSAEWNKTIGKLPMAEKFERDVTTFQDVQKTIPSLDIETFYNNKKSVFYINVAKYGLFRVGSYNPLLLDIPRFSDAVTCNWYANITGDDRRYNFVFGIDFTITGTSAINLDPNNLQLSGFGIA